MPGNSATRPWELGDPLGAERGTDHVAEIHCLVRTLMDAFDVSDAAVDLFKFDRSAFRLSRGGLQDHDGLALPSI